MRGEPPFALSPPLTPFVLSLSKGRPEPPPTPFALSPPTHPVHPEPVEGPP